MRFWRSKEEKFVDEVAPFMAKGLFSFCGIGANNVVKEFQDRFEKANYNNVFNFIVMVRATMEVYEVLGKFGKRAFKRILDAIDAEFFLNYPRETLPFSINLMPPTANRFLETNSIDPTVLIKECSKDVFGIIDPQFIIALTNAIMFTGDSLVKTIEKLARVKI